MKNWSIAAFIAGGAAMLFGLLGDTTVGGVSGGNRVHNLGLLGAQAAMVTAGGALLVVGAVLFAAGALAERLDAIYGVLASRPVHHGMVSSASQPGIAAPANKPTQTVQPAAPAAAPAPVAPATDAPKMPTGADAWRVASAFAEARGWRVTAGLLGVSLKSPDGRTFKPSDPQEVANLVAAG
jgi:hypothetical protein